MKNSLMIILLACVFGFHAEAATSTLAGNTRAGDGCSSSGATVFNDAPSHILVCNGTTWQAYTASASGSNLALPINIDNALSNKRLIESASGSSVFLGYNGDYNLYLGLEAGAGIDGGGGGHDVFIGPKAGLYNTYGYINTFVGAMAGMFNGFGVANTFLGSQAGFYNSSGSGNTLLGTYAGLGVTGNDNVYIGNATGYSMNNASRDILIGSGVGAPTSNTSDYLNIGNAIYGPMGTNGTSSITVDGSLNVSSTTGGFLPPRMSATQASAISTPAEGLLVYVTNTNGTFTAKGWWGYDGAAWQKLNN